MMLPAVPAAASAEGSISTTGTSSSKTVFASVSDTGSVLLMILVSLVTNASYIVGREVAPLQNAGARPPQANLRAGQLVEPAGWRLLGDLPVALEMRASQISLHSDWILHGSEPNRSNRRRCGLAMRYLSAAVRAYNGWNANSIWCPGIDAGGHWANHPRPDGEVIPTPTSPPQRTPSGTYQPLTPAAEPGSRRPNPR